MKKAILQINLSVLAKLLQLPADAEIALVRQDIDQPDTVKVLVHGWGPETRDGAVVANIPLMLTSVRFVQVHWDDDRR